MERVFEEVQVLVHGLWVGMFSSERAKSLPLAQPDIPLDTAVWAIFAFVLFCFNWAVRLLIVVPVARRALGEASYQEKSKSVKFARSFMEVLFYGGSFIVGLRIVPSQEWVWPSTEWWSGNQVLRADLRCYYILYSARYFQQLISVLLEPRQKDFKEMIIHHSVTIFVINLSYVYGQTRVGVMVMLLFDPADVFLHLAKMCLYIFQEGGRFAWSFAADRFFEIFAVIFIITRLPLYGYVCWSAHTEGSRLSPGYGPAHMCCQVALDVLMVLQVFWVHLLAKAIINKLMYGLEDVRSDDEDEAEPKKVK